MGKKVMGIFLKTNKKDSSTRFFIFAGEMDMDLKELEIVRYEKPRIVCFRNQLEVVAFTIRELLIPYDETLMSKALVFSGGNKISDDETLSKICELFFGKNFVDKCKEIADLGYFKRRRK